MGLLADLSIQNSPQSDGHRSRQRCIWAPSSIPSITSFVFGTPKCHSLFSFSHIYKVNILIFDVSTILRQAQIIDALLPKVLDQVAGESPEKREPLTCSGSWVMGAVGLLI